MKPTIMTQWMSFGPTMLTKDGTDQFILDSMSHHMTALPTDVQMLLFDYGNQLHDVRNMVFFELFLYCFSPLAMLFYPSHVLFS